MMTAPIELLPDFLRGVREITALLGTDSPVDRELTALYDAIDEVSRACVWSPDVPDAYLERWAKAYRANYEGLNASEIRQTVGTKIADNRPYTYDAVCDLIKDIIGDAFDPTTDFVVNHVTDEVTITFPIATSGVARDVIDLLDRVLPVEMVINYVYEGYPYNRYDQRWIHDEMSDYTQAELNGNP